MHVGWVKLQNGPLRVNSQICVLLLSSSKPVLQVYVTTLPSSVSVKLLVPFAGAPGSPQSTIVKDKHNSFVVIEMFISYIFQDRETMKESKIMHQ